MGGGGEKPPLIFDKKGGREQVANFPVKAKKERYEGSILTQREKK